MYLAHFEALRGPYVLRHRALWENSLASALLASAGSPAGGPPGNLAALALGLNLLTAGLELSPSARPGGGDRLAVRLRAHFVLHRDSAPPGLALLAIRAARRALHADPDNAQAYLLLGEGYHLLLSGTRERVWGVSFRHLAELRLIQAVSALRQALVRRPGLPRAHDLLAGLFRDMGYLDLALEHAQKHLQSARAAGPLPGESAGAFARRVDALAEALAPLKKQVAELRNRHEVNSAGLTVFDRAYLARQGGLAGKALSTLLASNNAEFGHPGVLLELELLLATGRLREVRDWMEPAHKAALSANRYHWLRAQLGAAGGDYAQADEDLAELAALSRWVRIAGLPPLSTRAALLLGAGRPC
jgi:hypothetical protein